MMFIKRLEVEGFRGFIEKQVFNLGQSKVIILFGPNGHGKTSFFDALEWGLTGRLHRYDTSNDERNRSKFIANQTKKSSIPKVKLVLRNSDEKDITIIRTGEKNKGNSTDYGKSVLEIINENGIQVNDPEDYLTKLIVNTEWLQKVNLNNINRMYNLTHNLGQEKITHFINDTKDGERYNSLSEMLGTDYFREYEIKFKNVKEKINNEIEERKSYLKEIENKKGLVDKEIELLQNQMDHQNVSENDIENLLKKSLMTVLIQT
ncbi:ATP-binding protein [Bacillus sp. Cs-700]|uniref:AAA family ATPase n=1 Tax=Bacillus sp. Cs-700 TaxID=2589818 RepID=UPI001407E2EA|nr:ATP-binding protein [Bacillus sp. Cs-700]